eukprot:gene10982-7626_t
MSRPWVRFLSSLELQGLTFEDIQLATDRLSVIHAAGITDPLTVAIVETEWKRRTGGEAATQQGTCSSAAGVTATPGPTPRPGPPSPSSNAGAGSPGSSSGLPLGGLPPSTPRGLGGLGGLGGLDVPWSGGDPLTLKDPSELKQLPEELQDVLLTREVLGAVLGLGGQWIQRSSDGFVVANTVPHAMRGLCTTILPVADAFVALRRVEDAEFLGKSLVAMAIGEVVSEITAAYALEVSKLQQWSRDDPFGRVMPLMRVVSDITRIGHHLVRLRQILPVELVNFSGAAADPVLCQGSTCSLPPAGSHTSSSGVMGPSATSSLLNASQQVFLSGPRLLNHLQAQLERCGGSKEESDVLQLLLRRALLPYLRMLQRWMHEGVLEDPFGEFFIAENGGPAASSTGGAGAGSVGNTYYYTSAQHRSSKHITELFPELTTGQELYVASPYRHYFNPSGSGAVGASTAAAQQEAAAFERRFSMNKLLMPSFLEKPSRIAKMVFFTGKYCCLLRECREQLPDFRCTTSPGPDPEAATSSNCLDLAESRAFVWQGVEDLHQKIQRSFELASQTVIQLLLSPSVDLLGHLSSIKVFYLHAQGDWITDFLDNADALLCSSRDKVVKGYSLRVLLQASIARCCTAQDAYHDIIGCSFSDSTLEQHVLRWKKGGMTTGTGTGAGAGGVKLQSQSSIGDGRLSAGEKVEANRCMELLQLEADLRWPLTLVLDPTVMARFNSIFRLLTWIKICERSLCVLWHTNEVLASFPIAYGIKHHFTQFLRQFQFFAAHFVLEPQWSRLMTRLGSPESLFSVTQSLNEFFTEVERGLTLSSTSRFMSLRSVLQLITRFCEVGLHSSTATLPLIEATLHSIQDQYLTTLSELASAVGPDYPQLVPLLTCIDFNGFYDRHNIYHLQGEVVYCRPTYLSTSRSLFLSTLFFSCPMNVQNLDIHWH